MDSLARSKNPHKKGTMEYLDFATAQHDKATAKPEPKVVAKKAPIKTKVPSREDRLMGLAGTLTRQREGIAKRFSTR